LGFQVVDDSIKVVHDLLVVGDKDLVTAPGDGLLRFRLVLLALLGLRLLALLRDHLHRTLLLPPRPRRLPLPPLSALVVVCPLRFEDIRGVVRIIGRFCDQSSYFLHLPLFYLCFFVDVWLTISDIKVVFCLVHLILSLRIAFETYQSLCVIARFEEIWRA